MTIDRAVLIAEVNSFLRNSDAEKRDERKLAASLTERVLMAADSYRGFNYIYWLDTGFEEWKRCGKPDFPEKNYFIYGPSGDDTRIQFY
jgi:hypothetical protein